jgi:uncharacterized protein YdeI (YjbR/CyaY-like superfamily)
MPLPATRPSYREAMNTQLAPDQHRALVAAGLLDQFQRLASDDRYAHLEWIAKATQPEARRYRITEMCEMLSPEHRPAG